MMRRLLALLLALMMALSLAGCGGGEDKEKSDAPEDEKTEQAEDEETEEDKEDEEDEKAEKAPDWVPEDDVNIVIPAAAGSLNDIATRVLAQYVERSIGRLISVENIPAAYTVTNEAGEVTFAAGAGTLAWTELAARDADGLTLGYIELPYFTNALYQWPDLLSVKDYTPVCTHTTQTAIIVIRATEDRFTTLKRMVSYGKRAEAPLVAATDGERGLLHTWTQLLCKDAGMPYGVNHQGSAGAALQCVRDGSADFAVVRADDILERDEGLQVLAVFGQDRLPLYPDAPTVSEQGFYPDWLGCAWCVVAPADTEPDAVAFYEQAFKQAMEDERYLTASSGVTTDFKDAEQTGELIRRQQRISLRVYNSLWW